MSRYESARELYREVGVDTDAAMKALANIRISMHCWQGDDIAGFENSGGPDGGIAATGNYPGKARNPDELFADISKAFSLIPGKHKVALHMIYAVTKERPDRDKLEPRHFDAWVDFAKAQGIGLDMNPTFFAHPKAKDVLTLSHPDKSIRQFWVDHGKASRRVAESFGRRLGILAVNNVWVPDGYKNIPVDRYGPRARLKESLDALFADRLDKNCIADTVESKLFGIGVECYTVGSHEFYLNYAARNDVVYLLDVGHFHPTEVISDKISSQLLFADKLALHVSRPVRWDSDHVVILDDELKEIGKELVRCKALERTLIGLDFFDASINRVSAWVVGMRNMQKSLLSALLTPHERYTKLQNEGNFSELLALTEELRLYPLGDVWDKFCETQGVPVRGKWFEDVVRYEKEVLSKRG